MMSDARLFHHNLRAKLTRIKLASRQLGMHVVFQLWPGSTIRLASLLEGLGGRISDPKWRKIVPDEPFTVVEAGANIWPRSPPRVGRPCLAPWAP